MANEPKFLLGRGETLNRPSRYRSGFGEADPVYTWTNQIRHLRPMFAHQDQVFERIPASASPNDSVVSVMTVHPTYYSRSAYPESLLAGYQLRLIGSKPVVLKPRAGRGSESLGGVPTTSLFVVGTRSSFRSLWQSAEDSSESSPLASELLKLESVEPFVAGDRVLGKISSRAEQLEVVLHHDAERDIEWEAQFLQFARDSGVILDLGREYQSRGLWFLPATGGDAAAKRLADFVFIRAIRPMPKLRPLEKPKVVRSSSASIQVSLPTETALDTSFRVAIFDGGLPADHPFKKWASRIEPKPSDNIGDAVPFYEDHGVAVTSALLFGHVQSGLQPTPYCAVDHFRVLGTETTDQGLYSVMLYIDRLLNQSTYEFVTLSVGPVEIVGDDKVTAWTTMLDDHFQQAQVLGTIAVGNDGEKDAPLNRVQVPSDCVNALAIGASDSDGDGWARASYSCVGPGRAPGLVKPDLLQFGGTAEDKFRFIFPGPTISEAYGTSFATPAVMRIASGVRAHFGTGISTLGIKALMIHSASPGSNSRIDAGWGLVPSDLADITVCPEGSVRVLYQGLLDPSKVIRTEVPLPLGELHGMFTITGTFCYLCQTDPHTPGDYTRAGLGITFRPHHLKFPKPKLGKKVDPDFPSSRSFFEGVGHQTEQVLRSDAFKWDTTRHAEDTMRASSLSRPVFDIHYQAREPGSKSSPASAVKLPYALVITVHASKHPDLYDRVAEAFPSLAAIKPRTNLPLPIRL